MTTVRVFAGPDALGVALAREIVQGIDRAGAEQRRYLLGCPGGRSGRSTYRAMAGQLRGADLRHLVIVMMDDYVERGPDGAWRYVPADSHYSCRRFATDEIAAPLSAVAQVGVAPEQVWLPDPADPGAFGARLRSAGGVDEFIVASGVSDGHVAFNPPGTPFDRDSTIVELAESTRRDNMATFPAFTSLDEVPTHGVSIGLGTIASSSRQVTLVLHGAAKQESARRVLAATDFDPAWPATFIHRCPNGRVWLDEAAAAGRGRH
jgi:glucosamine-6-phosphate deaminase